MKKILMKKIKYKIFFIIFLLYIENDKCYQKHNERLRKEERIKHQNLSEEEKDKRRKKVQERHQNLLEVEKKKKRQYHCERNKNLSEGQN